MNIVKKYFNWIVIGAIIVGGALFNWLYVGSLEAQAANEHKTVNDAIKKFNAMYEKKEDGLMQTPTRRDQQIGGEFMKSIVKEREYVTTLLKSRALFFDRCIVNGEVVYPADSVHAGKPVEEITFAEFLTGQYLQAMAEMENSIFKQGTPVWLEMLKQSIFATSPALKEINEATAKAETSAAKIAAAQSHIVSPAALIPFKLDENFRGGDNKTKRWLAWRQFLIFRDIMTRAVPNTSATVIRDVAGFERVGKEADILDNPKTAIVSGEGRRFIQNISEVKIELAEIGDAQIPEIDSTVATEKDVADGKIEKSDLPENGKYYDTYRVSLELTAHLKVVKLLQKEILATSDLYYVPVSAMFRRLEEKETMGDYNAQETVSAMPVNVLPDEDFKASSAVAVNVVGDYSYEPPVQARLEFLLYRPRFAAAPNPETAAVGHEEE